MHGLHLHWTLTPAHAPRPLRHCPGCGDQRAFIADAPPRGLRARLNANGKRLDGWLIYRCEACDQTWNRPIFERCLPSALPDALRLAFETNAQEPLRRIAYELGDLARHATRIEQAAEVSLSRRATWLEVAQIRITLSLTAPCALRLDRLLSAELGLSRSRLGNLLKDGRLQVAPARAFGRPVAAGVAVTLPLAGLAEGPSLIDRHRPPP